MLPNTFAPSYTVEGDNIFGNPKPIGRFHPIQKRLLLEV
jgi:hypothetical protein